VLSLSEKGCQVTIALKSAVILFYFRLTAKVDMMKMFGSAGSDGKMPLMMTSQNEKTGWFGQRGHHKMYRLTVAIYTVGDFDDFFLMTFNNCATF